MQGTLGESSTNLHTPFHPNSQPLSCAQRLGTVFRSRVDGALAGYLFLCSIVIFGLYSSFIVACLGIIAGSGFATIELQTLLSSTIEAIRYDCPGVAP